MVGVHLVDQPDLDPVADREPPVHGAARRARSVRTTVADTTAEPAADLVNRQFRADRPNRLWVCDLTYLRTWAGFAYLALVIDVYSRRIVGWALATHSNENTVSVEDGPAGLFGQAGAGSAR